MFKTSITSDAGAKPNFDSSKSFILPNPDIPKPALPKIFLNNSSGSMEPWKFSNPPEIQQI